MVFFPPHPLKPNKPRRTAAGAAHHASTDLWSSSPGIKPGVRRTPVACLEENHRNAVHAQQDSTITVSIYLYLYVSLSLSLSISLSLSLSLFEAACDIGDWHEIPSQTKGLLFAPIKNPISSKVPVPRSVRAP